MAPTFEWDPAWPKPLPEKWAVGPVVGVSVDTRDGTFVLQIGRQGQSGGNSDTRNLQRAADMEVDPATNELYVADGYGNRRVIVFDAGTGAFKRMWGAYGNRPDDADIGANDRVQVFTKDGTFVKEQFIARHTRLSGAASGVAFSADPEQRYLYVLDGANHRVWIALRESLEILGHFGRHGHWGGQLDVPHNVDADSSGNLYVTETLQGRRVQRFLYQGLAPAGRE